MRSGERLETGRTGGACQYTFAISAGRSRDLEFAEAGNSAAMENENCTLCSDAGCTNGPCVDGMFLQQSCGPWPWEQGIEAQQCIAACGVWIAEQSTA